MYMGLLGSVRPFCIPSAIVVDMFASFPSKVDKRCVDTNSGHTQGLDRPGCTCPIYTMDIDLNGEADWLYGEDDSTLVLCQKDPRSPQGMTHQEIEQRGCCKIVKATFDVVRSRREMRWTSRGLGEV